MNEQSGSIVLADVIAEFLEVALHMILFVRGIYPPELFESTQKYSCPIKTARHPGLKNYIQQILQSIRAELIRDTIHRICVVTLDPSTKPIDRFVFEMSVLEAFEDRFQIAPPQSQQQQHSVHAFDNTHQLEHLDGEHQIEQPETNTARTDKGKGKAIEYQHHDHQHQDARDYDEDVDVDAGVERGGFEVDNYEGYGGDHEQQEHEEKECGTEPGEHNKHDHHDAGGGGEGRGEGEEDEEEEEYDGEEDVVAVDGESPLVRRMRVQHTNKTTTADAVALAASHAADFPWSPISPASHQEQLKVSAPPAHSSFHRKIIPVKTVDVAGIQLELYLEKFGN
ncbi:MAD2 mitotic arrest deficient-like 2 [Linnemannia exigua]|uniref:MAD2 mitotic arrest deficient-like 2 n=1 Tax=Linnemannia exigua TaxID=604196 RepID=A0AAD4DJH8_9FUNG|nr:MAD2 mitotic arrest deficient-like 2 [Linnemannia exigua]